MSRPRASAKGKKPELNNQVQAEAGAVRRMHNHADATYHVFTLLTGELLLTVEGQAPVVVKAGDVLDLKGGVMHTFKNTGTVTATRSSSRALSSGGGRTGDSPCDW